MYGYFSSETFNLKSCLTDIPNRVMCKDWYSVNTATEELCVTLVWNQQATSSRALFSSSWEQVKWSLLPAWSLRPQVKLDKEGWNTFYYSCPLRSPHLQATLRLSPWARRRQRTLLSLLVQWYWILLVNLYQLSVRFIDCIFLFGPVLCLSGISRILLKPTNSSSIRIELYGRPHLILRLRLILPLKIL